MDVKHITLAKDFLAPSGAFDWLPQGGHTPRGRRDLGHRSAWIVRAVCPSVTPAPQARRARGWQGSWRRWRRTRGTQAQLVGRDASGPRTERARRSNPALREIGITYAQSSRWQKLAALLGKAFEAQVEASKRKAVASIDSANNAEVKRQHRADRERELAETTLAAARSRSCSSGCRHAIGSRLFFMRPAPRPRSPGRRSRPARQARRGPAATPDTPTAGVARQSCERNRAVL